MERKQLHPMIAGQLKLILNNKEIFIEMSHKPGMDTYNVFDYTGKKLITCVADETIGKYTIHALDELAANVKLHTKTPLPEQQNVFDIIDIIKKKYEKQKADNALSVADRRLMNMLSQYTSENSGK